MYIGVIVEKLFGYVNGSTFAGVVGILFKGPAQEGDLFPGNGIK